MSVDVGYLTVLWYTAKATGVAWHGVIVGENEIKERRVQLQKRFRGRGGVKTHVARYLEITEGKLTRPSCKRCGAYMSWGTAKKPLCPFCDCGTGD
ncbi:hypothetical protein LCGC14_2735580 [marine sediment metagenome]|uniref:Uncharacterized protein n=1 Tax=marine sediment metagenome TaxID=412755 RepID=A0A0F8Z611_9ZZZZ